MLCYDKIHKYVHTCFCCVGVILFLKRYISGMYRKCMILYIQKKNLHLENLFSVPVIPYNTLGLLFPNDGQLRV